MITYCEFTENIYKINGSSDNLRGGFIRSPFFPELYPKEFWMNYEIVAPEEKSRIQVLFEDFQISPWSFVEVSRY